MIKCKKILICYFLLFFCMILSFENYARTNIVLKGVEKSSLDSAPSGADFYQFIDVGDTGHLHVPKDLNNCTLRVYYVNRYKKNVARIAIYRTDKYGVEKKWTTKTLNSNKTSYVDIFTGDHPNSNYTYKIVLEKGSNVYIAVTCFDKSVNDKKEKSDKKYKY